MKANGIMVAVALVSGVGIGLLVEKGSPEPGTSGPGEAGHRDSGRSGSQPSKSFQTAPPVSGDAGRRGARSAASLAEQARLLAIMPRPEDCADALQLYAEWAEQDPYAAIARAIEMGEAGGHLRHRVMQVWARQDPAAAAEYFASHRSGFAQLVRQDGTLGRLATPGAVAQVIATGWGTLDADAALSWARTLPDGAAAVEAAIGAMAEQSPQRAIDALAGIETEAQGSYLDEIAKRWAAKDFSEARQWIGQLPEDRRNAALGSALTGLAETDPVRAVRELSEQAPPEVQQRLAGSLARAWSLQDPQAAAEWLKEPGNDSLRAMAAGPVVEALARKDAEAAWELVEGMGEGSARDQSLSSYISSQSHEHPAKMIDLCASIHDEATRGQAIAGIMAQWTETDPQAAAAFQQSLFSK